MPGWDFVPDAALAMAGDILSIKPGTHGHHAAYGHVAYVAWVDVDAEKIVTENYGRGMYYQREYTFMEFNAALKDGSFVVRHDPANDGTVLASMPMAGGDPNAQANTPEGAKAYAASKMAAYGWDANEYSCLVALWEHESGWRYDADNPYSDALGIPQGMTNLYPEVASERYRIDGNYQVDWGFDYIKGRYGQPCAAWAHWQNPPNYAAWGHWY